MKRIIAKLDIKSGFVIKGIEFEGVRKLGDPINFAKKYFLESIDEIIYLDCVASLYNRNHIIDLLPKVSQEVFIPITAGGGIRTFKDAKNLFDNGADKILINTGAVKNPKIVRQISDYYGSQAVVLQLDCKKINTDKWEVYIDYGREKTGIDAIEWIKKISKYGIGEILATVIDNDGKRNGVDLNFTKKVRKVTNLPIIAGGGVGGINDIEKIFEIKDINAVSISSLLHYGNYTAKELKSKLKRKGFNFRDD
jgi:cyclase